ncbi:alpha/beta hydrolase family protein [Mycobacteroides abscessus]|uniref:alpha/beta hydrolase n=1 Tax=Mycobacteroides abscessus TaxID=36809 RepID=UPI001D13BA02|nr:alpha/beta hydrolase [Mycobacteroides abscessus]UEA50378.1 alpha/beta hydrolase family protein [Mycobacteroides abscessus subsp. abscessus]UEA53814.1 alpha/beta hydrolase family protein [Mycobacteroides abscessus]
MGLNLRELRQLPSEVEALEQSTRAMAANHTNSADFYRELNKLSTWKGQGGDAAKAGMEVTARDHETTAETLNKAAGDMNKAHTESETVAKQVGDLLRDAAAHDPVAVEINEDTNQVIAPNTDYMDKEMAAKVASKVTHLQMKVAEVLAEGESVDASLARAISAATGTTAPVGGLPWLLKEITPLPEDPKQFTQAWNALSPEEKEAQYQKDHFIGNHPGMPFEDKTKFNERHLGELTHAAQANVDQLQSRVDQLARQQYMGDHSAATGKEAAELGPKLQAAKYDLARYQGVQEAMKTPEGTPKRYLGLIDDKGHAAVSIGNPDKATRNAVLVPGTGEDLTGIAGDTKRSLEMYNAALRADPNLQAGDVAVTSWLGYDRPMSVVTEAPWPSYAHNGAGALDSFEDGMRASHLGPPSLDTVIGHSYGTTLVGGAASGGHHLSADNIVAVASPGMLVDHAKDLSINSGGSVFVMTDPHDPIAPANLFTQFTLGPDPTSADFGGTALYAGTNLGIGPEKGFPSLAAHSGYWTPGTPALANLGAVIAGVPPPRPANS